jgi:hypothetical protein
MATLKFRELHGTLLIVHGQSPPTDAEWDSLMHAGETLGMRMRRCLVFADIQVTPSQRKQIADVVRRAQTERVTVITSSSLTRMVVTAVGWISGIHNAYSPREVPAALAAPKLSEQNAHELLITALAFARELGNDDLAEHIVRSLSAARGAA